MPRLSHLYTRMDNGDGFGIFCLMDTLRNSSEFADDIFTIAKHFRKPGVFYSAQIFGKFTSGESKILQDTGENCFKLVDTGNNRDSLNHLIASSILFWLWDCQKLSPYIRPHLIIITDDESLIPTLCQIRDRDCVNIIIGLDTMNKTLGKDDWLDVTPNLVEVADLKSFLEQFFGEIIVDNPTSFHVRNALNVSSGYTDDLHFTDRKMDQDVKFLERFQDSQDIESTKSDFSHELDWQIQFAKPDVEAGNSGDQSDSRHRMDSIYVPSSIAPSQMIGSGETDAMISPEEQRDLIQKLTDGINTGNVSYTVYILRSIYARQTKGFRIPSVLSYLTSTGEAHADVPFVLRCVLWCFGGQKGDSVQSFKYKMNKNIARWLVKDLQKRAMGSPFIHQLIPLTGTTVQELLRQVPELDLALDLLFTVRTPNPLQVLLPFVQLWSQSSDSNIVKVVRGFVKKHGLPEHVPGFVPPQQFAAADMKGVADLTAVNERLMSILEKAPHGVLGARIPDIYEREFGEPLYLHNMRLKDLLLGLGSVEMVTVAGSGDRLFRFRQRKFT